MDLIARFVIVPLAFASLLSGLIQAMVTPWGLFRHYWIVAKLLLTVFATLVLLAKFELIGYAASLAGETILRRAELHAAGIHLLVHAAGGLLVLLIPTVLSVYKPRGLTPIGRRNQGEQRTPLMPSLPSPRPYFDSSSVSDVWTTLGSMTITPRRVYVFGIIVIALQFFILHFTGVIPGTH